MLLSFPVSPPRVLHSILLPFASERMLFSSLTPHQSGHTPSLEHYVFTGLETPSPTKARLCSSLLYMCQGHIGWWFRL